MVLVKANGFVSKIYVCLGVATIITAALFFLTASWSQDATLASLLLCVCVSGFFVFLIEYFLAPYAYRRFIVNSQGVGCGRLFIRYEEIERITICRGYVKKQFGFKFDIISGFKEFEDIYLENLICINCDFEGYRGKNPKIIYIPLNKETHIVLSKYCAQYSDIVKEQSDIITSEPKMTRKDVVSQIMRALEKSIILFVITLSLFISGGIGIFRFVSLTLTGVSNFALIDCEPLIASIFRKITAFKDVKEKSL